MKPERNMAGSKVIIATRKASIWVFATVEISIPILKLVTKKRVDNNKITPTSPRTGTPNHHEPIASTDIVSINAQLQNEIGTNLWKGDLTRFATNGNQEGIFLLPNYEVKDVWFPTEVRIRPEPFEAIVENKGKEYLVEFERETIKTSRWIYG